MNQLDKLGLEEGMYMLGMPDPTDAEAVQESWNAETSTWAILNYRIDEPNSMTMPMIRGLLICIIISALLYLFFKQKPDSTLINKVLISVGIGFIAFLYIPYSTFIWYKAPDVYAHMLDGIVPWIVLGLLGHLILKDKQVKA
jgi:hypothetical protein